MTEVQRFKSIKAGGWKTLESGWGVNFSCRFLKPGGARVKIRYGDGRFLGRDSQKKTLDGLNPQSVKVGRGSFAYARVQMKVKRDEDEVAYAYITEGP
jgi:hypothetical protein